MPYHGKATMESFLTIMSLRNSQRKFQIWYDNFCVNLI